MVEGSEARPSAAAMAATGVLLFLFIPLVLFLFVTHPEPVGWSLAAGVGLMVAHRFLARPYMHWARPHKCLWCNRRLGDGGEALRVCSGGSAFSARFCPGHRRPAERFLRWVERFRWPLRLGIFVPLLLLLGALLARTIGVGGLAAGTLVEQTTAIFRLVVGLTVQFAALGAWLGGEGKGVAEDSSVSVPFPIHNFYLLGIRSLLWIFRLVGLWWIVVGIQALL